MSSINFYSNYSLPQSAVAFRGKASVSKATLDSLKHYKETVANMPERKAHFFFANIESSIKSWFKELKLRISGTTTKELIEIASPEYKEKEAKAVMEYFEALYKIFLKK